jgi:hypothetical protein
MKRGELPGTGRRGNRLIRERVHDPYKTRLKLPDPTVWTEASRSHGLPAVRCCLSQGTVDLGGGT